MAVPAAAGSAAIRLRAIWASSMACVTVPPSRSGLPTTPASSAACTSAVSCTSRATCAARRWASPLPAVKSSSGDIASPAWLRTRATASASAAPVASMWACTSVVKGLTKTLSSPLRPLAGARSVKALPTVLPVSASMALAGTSTTTRWRPASAGSTRNVKRPAASVVSDAGSPLSQAPLSLRS